MPSLFFILLGAFLVSSVIVKQISQRHEPEPPLLPTNQGPYSSYTEPRSNRPPVETPSPTPRSFPSSPPRSQSSADPNSFITKPRLYPEPRPLLPPVPSSDRKPQQYSFSRDRFPGISVEQFYRPATKAPAQKIVEPVLDPAHQPPPSEALFGARKPQQYSYSRNDLPGSLVEPIYRQAAARAPAHTTVEPSLDSVHQPQTPEPLFGARKPQQYSFSRDDLPRTSIEPIHQPATKTSVQPTVEPYLGSIYQPPTPEPVFGARKPQQYSFSRDDLPRPLIENVYRPAVQKIGESRINSQPFKIFESQDEGTIVNDESENDDDIKDLDHLALRKLANQEMENIKKCRTEERLAKRCRQFIRVKELSVKAQQHEKRMQELNNRASEVVFAKNNKDSTLRRIDLHGLTVKEAIDHTTRVLKQARELGNSEMRIIVGRGNHSKDGQPKLRPAIRTFLKKNQFPVELDPRNDGALVVKLNSAPGS